MTALYQKSKRVFQRSSVPNFMISSQSAHGGPYVRRIPSTICGEHHQHKCCCSRLNLYLLSVGKMLVTAICFEVSLSIFARYTYSDILHSYLSDVVDKMFGE